MSLMERYLRRALNSEYRAWVCLQQGNHGAYRTLTRQRDAYLRLYNSVKP